MSKIKKGISPKDLLLDLKTPLMWRDFKKILNNYGFECENKKGSIRVFVHNDGVLFNAHEPHGREKTTHHLDRKKAWEAIERVEESNEERY